jgi:UDP-glucose 4-epimerase
MTILVTGGAGYIGSHMVYALIDVGEKVVVLDDLSTGFEWSLPPNVPLVVADIGDQAHVSAVIKEHRVGSIIHLAASVVASDSVIDPLSYYRNNTDHARDMIECAVRGGVQNFIYSSTAAVYGNPARIPVSEHDPPAPISPYGRSKLMAETILRDASSAHGMRHVILRYFNVAGADPQLRTGQSTKDSSDLIKVAVEAALGRRSRVIVFGTDYPTSDGTCVRDYIHVWDLVQAHIYALNYLRDGGSDVTLNCGYGRGYSVLEVIETVKKVSKSNFKVDHAPRRPGDPDRIIASAAKAQSLLGWQPRYDDIVTIVDHSLTWEHKLLLRGQ